MDLTFTQQLQQFIASHTILVGAWAVMLIAVVITLYKGATSKVKVLDNTQATLLINKQDAVVIDLRGNDEFKAGHIIGSLHLLPSEIKNNNLHHIDKYKAHPLILVDANGLVSNSSAQLLAKQGFSQVHCLKEGIAGWRAANLPLVRK